MKNILITAAVMIALIGCTSRSDAPPPIEANPPVETKEKPSAPAADEEKPVVVTAEKPIIEDENELTEKEKKPAEKEADAPTDDFGLPLVIVMEVPEAPESISKPSPPIKEGKKPDETPKKGGGFW